MSTDPLASIRPAYTIRATTVSRIIGAASRGDRRLLLIHQDAYSSSVTIRTTNAARHQLLALSRARRLLRARGYAVETHRQESYSILTVFRPHYFLVVTKAVS